MQSSSYPFITPSSTCMSEDLLFFDTFSHSNSDKDNFDLVQFPSPVIIDLIKIVPLGQPVEANIPGNVRLGATNPSKCEIEFFINDLTKQDAHTMTDLGKFYCTEKDSDFAPPVQIQTDGLLLRGSYRTLTLAIFGQIVAFDEKPEEEHAIISAASPPAQTPASPVASERDIPPYIVRNVNQELLQQANEDQDSADETVLRPGAAFVAQDEGVSNDMNEDTMMESSGGAAPLEPSKAERVLDLDELSNSGDGATPVGYNNSNNSNRDKKLEEIDYSTSSDLDNSSKRSNKHEIISVRHMSDKNEDLETKQHHQQQQAKDDSFADYDAHEWSFNIATYSPKPLSYFPDPSLTLQERTLLAHKSKSGQQKLTETVDKEVEKVKEMFEVLGCSSETKSEDWVTLVEDLANDVANMSLSQTVSNQEMLEYLVKQVLCGLDISAALRQKQTGFKVRHLKAGLKLATILFHCGPPAVTVLLDAGVLQKVLQLYNQEHMSLPLRLHIFKCLNSACDSVDGVEHIISHKHHWDDAPLIKESIKKKLMNKNMTEDMTETEKLLEVQQQQENQTHLTCYQYMLLLLLTQPVTRITIAIGNLIKKIRLYRNLSELNSLTRVSSETNSDDNTEDSVFERDQNETTITDKSRLEKGLQIVQDVVFLTKEGCSHIAQPVRHLPAKVQFHIKPSSSDSSLALYKWIKHFKIIECLDSLLISTRETDVLDIEQSIKLRGACLAMIQQVLDLPRGTQLLLSNDCYKQTASLIRNLAQKIDPNNRRKSHPDIENLADASLYREESLSIATCRDMSLKLAYCFKVLSCIDKLFDFHRELINSGSSNNSSNKSNNASKCTPYESSKQICDPEKVLHQLFLMSDHPYGLTAIMKHFSCIGNLDCILRFLDMPEYHQKHLEFVRETSIDYVLELVGTFFRLNNNVLEIAEEYLDTLVDLCKIKDKTLSTRIKSLLPWLTPFETDQPFPLITYSEETFRQLTRVIRKSIPDCSIPFAQGLNYELPPQLITAVRILRQLCVSPQVESFIESNFDIFSSQRLFLADEAKSSTSLPFVDSLPRQQNPNQSWNLNFQSHSQNYYIQAQNNFHSSIEDSLMDRLGQLNNLSKLYLPYDEIICGDLKYHYGIMQVFEQEGLKRLLNTLRELMGNYPRPIYQSAALCGLRGRIVISYIHSVIMLLHSITCHLIDARGKEFRDTSIISVVLETYSLLCFAPKPEHDKLDELSKREELSALQKSITLKYDNYQLAQQTKKLILSILISYTQICLSVSESEENVISKSMWTKMLKEVIEFTLSAPVFFHHGLDVLTRILPAPFPSSNILDTIDQEQLFKNINHRKLWSAHLHPLHQRIESMISNMSLCNQSNIRTLLYYLCNQLCDLSSNAACMVVKTITDTLITCAAKLTVDQQHQQQPPTTNGGDTSTSASDQVVASQASSRQSEDRTAPATTNSAASCHIVVSGTKESKFAVKMVLGVVVNLITNQAFETAFTNHLQVISKKDEKLLVNLHTIIRSSQEEFSNKQSDQSVASDGENNIGGGGGGNKTATGSPTTTAASVIECIRAIAEISNNSKDNFGPGRGGQQATPPPEELTKVNLIEMARKTSDRFNLTTGITKTYRLKVLMDINSRAHRSIESSSSSKRFDRAPGHQEFPVQSSHKPFVAPVRGNGGGGGGGGGGGRSNRSSMRPDSFRSRPQNTSRLPSIHVDDFNDLYGDAAGGGGGGSGGVGRYGSGMLRASGNKGMADDYRHSPSGGRYPQEGRVNNSPMSGPSHGGGGGRQAAAYFGGQQSGQQQSTSGMNYPPHGGGGGGGGGGGRRSKYMKTK